MKENWNLSLTGQVAILVPYRKRFVAKYHEWMQSPALLEATASEPLSLDEEYEMQRTWHVDPTKCTFIVLSKAAWDSGGNDEVGSMAGDVNLFFNVPDDPHNAEIEVMIAETAYRRQGLATDALKVLMGYAATALHVARFYAKIGEANAASLELFKGLGFREIAYVKAFGEYEYEFLVPRDDGSSEHWDTVQQWAAAAVSRPYSNGEDDEDDAS
jgi:RimJ/RimL family protein N-acetyltransferase